VEADDTDDSADGAARAPKAGAVQPLTRKMAGSGQESRDGHPRRVRQSCRTMPTRRRGDGAKRKPKTTTEESAARWRMRRLAAPGMGLNWRKRNMRSDEEERAAETTMEEGRARLR